jgi:AraC-like DNA-binding protein
MNTHLQHTYAVDPGWRVLWRDLGLDESELLRRAALPADLLAHHDERISALSYFDLWRAMETCSGDDPALPSRVAEIYSVESFQPPLFAALCSPNLHIAMQRLSLYKALIGPMRLDLSDEPDAITLTLSWIAYPHQVPIGLMRAELCFLVRLARIATRAPIQPLRATCPPSASPPPDSLHLYLGTTLQPNPSCSLTFSHADATSPFVTRNEAMWQVFEPSLRQRLDSLQSAASVATRTRASLLELLPSGRAALHHVATSLAMSTRTLQRRLHDEGTSFQIVLTQTRHDLAMSYLRHTSLHSAEIAFLLGFEETSSFFRAFHDWTGTSPERARASLPPD